MAAEALCRGAAVVLGIEESKSSSELIRENCQKLVQGDSQFRLINGRVQKFLPTLAGQQFDRIYCDPPFISKSVNGDRRASAVGTRW
jgi:16S rRNA (guanine966-N2)-methyltransferase